MNNYFYLTQIVIVITFITFSFFHGAMAGYIWRKTISASFNWKKVAASKNGQYLMAVSLAKDSNPGAVYVSRDFGNSWTSESPNGVYTSKTSWYSCAVDSTGKYMAAGGYGLGIYVSSDYGYTWNRKLSTSSGVHFIAYSSAPSGKYVAAALTNGYIAVSYDYGVSWFWGYYISGVEWYGVAMDITGNYMLASGTKGVFRSTNGGRSWIAVYTSSDYIYFINVASSQDGSYIAFSIRDAGAVVYSSDYGNSWRTIYGVTAASSVAMDATGRNVYVGANTGNLYQSSNYGQTYEVIEYDNIWWSCIALFSSGSFIVSVNPGYVYILTVPTPTYLPTFPPTFTPPTQSPTKIPTYTPSRVPSREPTQPTWKPTTASPTVSPTFAPTTLPTTASPSEQPTSFPTSQPSCSLGKFMSGNGTGCSACPVGSYGNANNLGQCTPCSIGTYQDDIGQKTCKTCPYPWSNNIHGSKSIHECTAVHFKLEYTPVYVVGATLVLWTFITYLIWKDPYRSAILMNLLIPSFDAFTSIAYILSTKYFSIWILILLVLCSCHGMITFFLKLYLLRPEPGYRNHLPSFARLWLLGVEFGDDCFPFPTWKKQKITILLEIKRHDSLYKVIWQIIVWFISILYQIVYTCALLIFDFCIYPYLLIIWLFVGVLFEMTNTLAIGRVWDLWFRMWTESHEYSDPHLSVDTSVANYGLMNRLLFETLPSTLLQVFNNMQLHEPWTPTAIISVAASGVAIVNLAYVFLYYRFFLTSSVEMVDVPIDNSIKIAFFGYEKTLINGKLPSASHKHIANRPKLLKLQTFTSSSKVNPVSQSEIEENYIYNAQVENKSFKLLADREDDSDRAVLGEDEEFIRNYNQTIKNSHP